MLLGEFHVLAKQLPKLYGIFLLQNIIAGKNLVSLVLMTVTVLHLAHEEGL